MKLTNLIRINNGKSISRLLLVTALSSYSLFSYAQHQQVHLTGSNVTLKSAFKQIEQQTKLFIDYNTQEINDSHLISKLPKNNNVKDVMEQLLKGTGCSIAFSDRHIIITKQTKPVSETKKVSGVIYDPDGEPVIGANILEKGTKDNGVISDVNGQFSLNVDKNATLIISFVGFKNQEISVKGKEQLTIKLANNTELLDEVVVIGYGSMKRKEITGAVTSVAVDRLPSASSVSVAQMLNGRAAGLYANLSSAQPGAKTNLRIRGTATGRDPLIVIDGFPVTDFSDTGVGPYGRGNTDAVLSSINPDDIASIDILKDASATSVYGTRAAGGVILITTKKGKSGKASVSFNANIGFSELYGLPDLLGPVDYMKAVNSTAKEIYMYNNKIGVYGDNPMSSLDKWVSPYSEEDYAAWQNKKGTNWMDEISRTAMVQNYGASVQGGSETSKYYASVGYSGQEGVIKNNDYNKYTGLFNIDQKFGNKVNLNLNLNASRIQMGNIALQEGYGGQSDIVRTALSFPSNLPVRNEEGEFSSNPLLVDMDNPVSFLDITNKTRTDRLMGHASLSYEIIKGLTIKGMAGFDYVSSQGYSYLPKSTRLGSNANGQADRSLNEKNDYQLQLTANYNVVFKELHLLNVMAGTEFMSMNKEGFRAGNKNFMTDTFLWYNLGLGASASPTVGSSGSKSETLSYIVRASYSFDERYFVTANLRVDGSSNFAKNHQWGYFPGVSVGWDIAREPFMESTSRVLNQLKVRLGYGQTGNDKIGSALTDYYKDGKKVLIGNNLYSSTVLGGFGNPDLKWETQTDFNVGVDFSLWNGRLSGSAEYFNRVISDLLGKRSLSSANELTEIVANLDSKKQTYGYEVTLNSKNIMHRDFTWNTTATFSYYRDRWLKRDRNWVPDINDSPKAFLNELWYYESDGLVQVGDQLPYTDKPIPGTVKIKDVDGYLLDENGDKVLDENNIPKRLGHPDGMIDNADKQLMGVNAPYTIGLMNSFSYKNFDLNISMYGSFNHLMVNSTVQLLTNVNDLKLGNNIMYKGLNSWSSDNQTGYYPSANQSSSKYGVGDFYLEKAWYIRVSNIDLGYTFHLEKYKIDNLRLYASLRNPFLITPYEGLDPETDSRAASYPNNRTYSIGVQFNF